MTLSSPLIPRKLIDLLCQSNHILTRGLLHSLIKTTTPEILLSKCKMEEVILTLHGDPSQLFLTSFVLEMSEDKCINATRNGKETVCICVLRYLWKLSDKVNFLAPFILCYDYFRTNAQRMTSIDSDILSDTEAHLLKDSLTSFMVKMFDVSKIPKIVWFLCHQCLQLAPRINSNLAGDGAADWVVGTLFLKHLLLPSLSDEKEEKEVTSLWAAFMNSIWSHSDFESQSLPLILKEVLLTSQPLFNQFFHNFKNLEVTDPSLYFSSIKRGKEVNEKDLIHFCQFLEQNNTEISHNVNTFIAHENSHHFLNLYEKFYKEVNEFSFTCQEIIDTFSSQKILKKMENKPSTQQKKSKESNGSKKKMCVEEADTNVFSLVVDDMHLLDNFGVICAPMSTPLSCGAEGLPMFGSNASPKNVCF
jgi:hypothetical protein